MYVICHTSRQFRQDSCRGMTHIHYAHVSLPCTFPRSHTVLPPSQPSHPDSPQPPTKRTSQSRHRHVLQPILLSRGDLAWHLTLIIPEPRAQRLSSPAFEDQAEPDAIPRPAMPRGPSFGMGLDWGELLGVVCDSVWAEGL